MATFSTGLKQNLITGEDFKTAMDGGFIFIYGWGTETTVPAPDAGVDTAGGDYVLLAMISASGGTTATGLNFDEPTGGVVTKAAAQTWDNSSGGNLATGTARFYVHTAAAENSGTALGASTTAERIVGTVGLAGADMQLGSTTLTATQTQEISYYNLTFGAG